MRLKDAYRKGTISYEQYLAYLQSGLGPNDFYNTSLVPSVPENVWVEILDWDTDGMGTKNITIENLDSVYDLDYKIEIYIDDILVRTDSNYIEVSSIYTLYIGDPCSEIVVSVRSSEYGQLPSYDFAYINEY